MKTFTELANEFESGYYGHILKQMEVEFAEKGVQENNFFNTNKQCSYMLGFIVGLIEPNSPTFAYIDRYTFRENYKKPMLWAKTLAKPGLTKAVLVLDQEIKDCFSHILSEISEIGISEVDASYFISGLLSGDRDLREKITQKLLDNDITQKQLAHSLQIPESAICRFLGRKANVSADKLEKIIKFLKMDLF